MAHRYQAPELVSALRARRPDNFLRVLDAGAVVDERDTDGRTALMHAAILGDLPAVTRLLERGADPSARDEIAWTALHYAVHGLHVDVVDALLATSMEVRIDSISFFNSDRAPASERLERAKVVAKKLCAFDGQHPEGLTDPLAPTSIKLRIAGKKVSMNLVNGGGYSLAPSKRVTKAKARKR